MAGNRKSVLDESNTPFQQKFPSITTDDVPVVTGLEDSN
jgi:hypothetical protein